MLRKIIYVLGICLVSVNLIHAQTKPAADNPAMYNVVKQQADAMAQAFVKGDYHTFAHYTSPRLVKMMGGQARMITIMDSTIKLMKAQGMNFSAVKVDAPSKIVKSNNELQCILAQHSKVNLPTGGATITSSLIAISTDGGKDWKFIDTSNKDMAAIKKLLPDLSPQIVIPPTSQPVFGN